MDIGQQLKKYSEVLSTSFKLTEAKILYDRRPLPFNPFIWRNRNVDNQFQDVRLSELADIQNPYFNSLQRKNNYRFSVDRQMYRNYALPDVISLKNYGLLPYNISHVGTNTFCNNPQSQFNYDMSKTAFSNELGTWFGNSYAFEPGMTYTGLMRGELTQNNFEVFDSHKIPEQTHDNFQNYQDLLEGLSYQKLKIKDNFVEAEKDMDALTYDQRVKIYSSQNVQRDDHVFKESSSSVKNSGNIFETYDKDFHNYIKREAQNFSIPFDNQMNASSAQSHSECNGESDQHSSHAHALGNAWVTFNNVSTNPLSADAPDLTNFSSVEEWLNSIKMARYLENFHSGGITSMDAVVNLTVKELTDLGITLVGHQKKIMNSVQNIRAQIRVNGSEGFLV